MQITLLGTGSALPSSSRLQTGIHISKNDHHLLVDCGSGITHRLAQAGIDHRAVDTVLLTHHHLDHVADLPTLAKARSLDDHTDLTVIGPPGTQAICTQLLGVDNLTDRIDLTVAELTVPHPPFECGPHQIATAQTVHSKPGLAYCFDRVLTISGDTAPTPAIADLADGSDVLIHECAYPDRVDTTTHTTPTALGAAIQDIDIDRLYLTHLFPETEPHSQALTETVADYTAAEVGVATDLDTLTVHVDT